MTKSAVSEVTFTEEILDTKLLQNFHFLSSESSVTRKAVHFTLQKFSIFWKFSQHIVYIFRTSKSFLSSFETLVKYQLGHATSSQNMFWFLNYTVHLQNLLSPAFKFIACVVNNILSEELYTRK